MIVLSLFSFVSPSYGYYGEAGSRRLFPMSSLMSFLYQTFSGG